jgi:hypothetical protein
MKHNRTIDTKKKQIYFFIILLFNAYKIFILIVTTYGRYKLNKYSEKSMKIKSTPNYFLNTIQGLKIREFRIQGVVGKEPVELEKYLENISTLILFNT